MTAILRKELKGYYVSLSTYVYYALFFLILGVCFVKDCLATYSTEFGYYALSRAFMVILVITPLFTMHLLAQEKKNRTDQLLFTVPVSSLSVLLGKYFATAIVLFVPFIVSVGFPIYIAGCGEMSVRFLLGSYLAVVLVSLVVLAIGMFVSSLTSNMVLSVVLAYGLYIIVLLGRIIENFVPVEWVYQMFRKFSVYNIYHAMVSGIVRSGDIFYLLLLSIFFFGLTWNVVEKKRSGTGMFVVRVAGAVVACVIMAGISMHFTHVYDFTSEHLLTLSEETKNAVSALEKDTDIYYLGERSRANATYQELLSEYADLSSHIHIHYKNVQSDADFRDKYLANVTSVNETSMVVVSGEKYVFLDAERYVTTIQTSKYSYKSILELENQLTSAIYYVNAENSLSVYCLKGHGEADMGNAFSNMLRMNNYEMKELNLAQKLNSVEQTFPDSCKMVLIASPQTDLSEDEIKALEDYMDDGGRIFVSIDPLNENLDNLYAFMEQYGLKIQKGVLVEGLEGNYIYDTTYYLKPEIQSHAITDALDDNHLMVLTMTSKGIYKDGKADGYRCTDLLTTSTKTIAKVSDFEHLTTKGEEDVTGSFSVASLSEKEEGGKMILLTSDIFFQDEVDSDSEGGNRQFFLSAVNYLADNAESGIMISGKEVGDQVALYPNESQTFVKIIVLVILPVCILFLGIGMVMGYRNNIVYKFKAKRKQKHEKQENKQNASAKMEE